jgi:hypothetical protein
MPELRQIRLSCHFLMISPPMQEDLTQIIGKKGEGLLSTILLP